MTNEHKFIDRFGAPVELVLYKYDACPFCMRVMWAIDRIGLPIERRDTRKDPAAAEELRKIGGKQQVPMLAINGKPLYESADIIAFLENEVELAKD